MGKQGCPNLAMLEFSSTFSKPNVDFSKVSFHSGFDFESPRDKTYTSTSEKRVSKKEKF